MWIGHILTKQGLVIVIRKRKPPKKKIGRKYGAAK